MHLPINAMSRTLLGATVATFGMSFASLAMAQETCSDDTCPQGYDCVEYTGGCIDIACVDDSAACSVSCDDTVYTMCQPAACESDADCGADMVCAALESTSCSGATASCAEGEDCGVVVEDSCTTETINQCTPKWQLPCETAADCGEGFECVESVIEWCSGGSTVGSEPADPAAGGSSSTETTSTEAECGSEATGEYYCKVIETACETDADCPANWTCIDNPSGACWADSEGNTGCDVPDPARLCQPPYADYGVGLASTTGAAEAGLGTSDVALDDAAANGEAPAAVEGSGTEQDEASGGGCSVSSALGHSSGFGSAFLLGLAALLRRRRSRSTSELHSPSLLVQPLARGRLGEKLGGEGRRGAPRSASQTNGSAGWRFRRYPSFAQGSPVAKRVSPKPWRSWEPAGGRPAPVASRPSPR